MSKEEKYILTAVCAGEVIKLEDVCDDVFSSGILGIGFAIIPESKDFLSPVDGKISNAHESGHAYVITAKNGIQVLLHIGINTVELSGEYFSPAVKEDMTVFQGERLTYADTEKILSRGFDPVTMTVITNPEIIDRVKITYGRVSAGETVMEYTLK